MYKKILFSLLFLSFFIGFSQKNNQVYDFFGGKTYANKAVFYRLLFEMDNGKIAGYAYTGEQGVLETKSIINGTFDITSNRIVFNETSKLITNSRQKIEELCYLNGIVTLQLNDRISKIKGTFIEMTASGEDCQKGDINIISMGASINLKKQLKVEKLLAKTTIKEKEKSIKKIEKKLPSFNSNEKITIKTDGEITIFWNSDTIKLEIWDDSKEDGDEITIVLDNEIVLQNFKLHNKKESIELSLKNKKNKLIFTANNAGLIGNNTARVDLFDKSIKHQIITQLGMNKSVTIYLIKQ